jgi:glycosyltransferase involved in cell wall biosynthesis
LAKFFYDKFNVNTIVSSPVHTLAGVHEDDGLHEFDRQIISNPIVLFYPALARTFKNFELVLAAFEYLSKYSPGVYKRLKLILTIGDGNGRYERKLVSKYAHLTNVSFVGILTREDVDRCYQLCDVVIFPSRLETWGLPISEAKSFNKPLLLADLPYARETLGVYDRVKLINVDDYKELAIVLGKLFLEESVFSKYDDRSEKVGKSINSWDELRDYIMKS